MDMQFAPGPIEITIFISQLFPIFAWGGLSLGENLVGEKLMIAKLMGEKIGAGALVGDNPRDFC